MPILHTYPVNDRLDLFSVKVLLNGQHVASAMPSKWRHVAGSNGMATLHRADCGWITEVSAEALAYIDELLLALSDEEDYRLQQQAERAPYGPVR